MYIQEGRWVDMLPVMLYWPMGGYKTMGALIVVHRRPEDQASGSLYQVLYQMLVEEAGLSPLLVLCMWTAEREGNVLQDPNLQQPEDTVCIE